jgi:hypothetical protein
MIASLSGFIRDTAAGMFCKVALEKSGLQWSQVNAYKARYPEFLRIYGLATRCGEQVRQFEREQEAHRRAVEGTAEPVWNLKTGERLGERRVYSDTLMLALLKAADPERYSERSKVQHEGGAGLTIITEGVVLGVQPAPKTYDVASFASGSADKAQPKEGNSANR